MPVCAYSNREVEEQRIRGGEDGKVEEEEEEEKEEEEGETKHENERINEVSRERPTGDPRSWVPQNFKAALNMSSSTSGPMVVRPWWSTISIRGGCGGSSTIF